MLRWVKNLFKVSCAIAVPYGVYEYWKFYRESNDPIQNWEMQEPDARENANFATVFNDLTRVKRTPGDLRGNDMRKHILEIRQSPIYDEKKHYDLANRVWRSTHQEHRLWAKEIEGAPCLKRTNADECTTRELLIDLYHALKE